MATHVKTATDPSHIRTWSTYTITLGGFCNAVHVKIFCCHHGSICNCL